MKFFFLKKHSKCKNAITFKNKYTTPQYNSTTNISNLCGIFNRRGNLSTYRLMLCMVCKNLNVFLNENVDFIYLNYSNNSWLFENIFEKKLNYQNSFDDLVNLLKPPFVIKSILVPKKLKKKTKIKYDIKIVYKREDKRVKNTLKQIYHNSNNYLDNSIQIRMYKSMLFSLLDWKQSNLFKFKLMVFKNFFKS